MILAERGEFDEALKVQSRSGCQQRQPCQFCDYWGLGDLLLFKGKPDLAVESFGLYNDALSSGQKAEWQRAVLAEALLATGDNKEAEKLLAKSDSTMTALLRIANLVQHGKNDKAKEIGAKVVAPWPEGVYVETGSLMSPELLYQDSAPKSLKAPIKAAVAWLSKEFPKKQFAIEDHLGKADLLFSYDRFPFYHSGVLQPTSKLIPDLQRQLAMTADPEKQYDIRDRIARELEDAEDYEAAAKANIANIVSPQPAKYGEETHLSSAAVRWCICNRREQTLKFIDGHPERLLAAGRAIPNPGSWTEKADVDGLTAMGPGVLGLVFEGLEPNAINGKDRSAFVQVIANLGSEQDAPILIDVLQLVVRSSMGMTEWQLSQPGQAENDARDSLTEAAIHQALEKLTKTKNTATGREERVQFWISWWNANARRIVNGSH